MAGKSSLHEWAYKVRFQSGMLFPQSNFPPSFWMLATLTLEYFCIYNQETFKECYSAWLIKDPWFMACLIPPDFHWVVAWRDGVIYSDFVIVGERHIFVTYQVQSCIPGIYSFCMFISFVTVKWLVHGLCDPCHLRDTVATSSEVRRPLSAIQQEQSRSGRAIYFLEMQESI